jgi:hypothetical protein
LVLLIGLAWLRRPERRGRGAVGGALAIACATLGVVTLVLALEESREWLRRSAVYHAAVAMPGTRAYEWARAQGSIEPSAIEAESERLWSRLAGESPSASGAQELAGLITQQGDARAMDRAWNWYEQATPADAWQVVLLSALQHTRHGSEARKLAWTRLVGDPKVGLQLAGVLADGLVDGDRPRMMRALGSLPNEAVFKDLRDRLREMESTLSGSPATTQPDSD